jgi:hypothetical protein
VKMILTSAETPDEYIQCLGGWQQAYAAALRSVVRATAPAAEERLKWGHIVYFLNGPVLLIRAEPARVLFGFWRGKRLRHIEPRLKPGGKYEMATLKLREGTPLLQATVAQLAQEAFALNRSLGNPVQPSAPSGKSAG